MAGPAGIALLCGCVVNSRITPLWQVQQALLCSVGVLFTRYNSHVAGPAGIALLCGCVVHQI